MDIFPYHFFFKITKVTWSLYEKNKQYRNINNHHHSPRNMVSPETWCYPPRTVLTITHPNTRMHVHMRAHTQAD